MNTIITLKIHNKFELNLSYTSLEQLNYAIKLLQSHYQTLVELNKDPVEDTESVKSQDEPEDASELDDQDEVGNQGDSIDSDAECVEDAPAFGESCEAGPPFGESEVKTDNEPVDKKTDVDNKSDIDNNKMPMWSKEEFVKLMLPYFSSENSIRKNYARSGIFDNKVFKMRSEAKIIKTLSDRNEELSNNPTSTPDEWSRLYHIFTILWKLKETEYKKSDNFYNELGVLFESVKINKLNADKAHKESKKKA